MLHLNMPFRERLHITCFKLSVVEIREKTSEIELLQTEVQSLKQVIKQQNSKLADLEDRSRRCNVIIHGIKEQQGDNEKSLQRAIVDELFSQKLNQTIRSVARIHRLGQKSGNRPVIVYFQDFLEKQVVMRNARKLKGTNIYFQNDYSQHTLRKRRLLWESAQADKAQAKRVFLVNEKLSIDGSLYAWDDTTNQRVLFRAARKPRDSH